jgi:hypothetical protein
MAPYYAAMNRKYFYNGLFANCASFAFLVAYEAGVALPVLPLGIVSPNMIAAAAEAGNLGGEVRVDND